MMKKKKRREKMQDLMDEHLKLQNLILKSQLDYTIQLHQAQTQIIDDCLKLVSRYAYCPKWLLQKKLYFGW